MNSNKISVVIAVHNGERYISSTIQSLLEQTYKDFEIIIVVNCSDDTTMEILKSLQDPRIKIFETNICQLTYNLNYGLQQASGDYVVRIDADDMATPNRLQKQLKTIEQFDYDVVGSNITYIDENTNIVGEKIYPATNESIRSCIYYKNPLAHPSVMYKKKIVLDNSGYLNGKVSEDYDLWLRLMRNKKIKFYNIQEPLTMYRIHGNQARGNKLAYAEIAGYFLREALYLKSLKSFFGCIIYIGKMVFK